MKPDDTKKEVDLGKEHTRLVQLFDNYRATKKIDLVEAGEIFNEFSNLLQKHMLWEERILFPILRKNKSLSHEHMVDLIRSEHIKILAYLKHLQEEIEKELDTENEEEKLILALIKHEEFEDGFFHPIIISLLEEEEKAEIFKSIDY